MSQTQQNTTRATGKRAVRQPLRFSNQAEFIPSKFGVTVDGSIPTPTPTPTPMPSTNDSWGNIVNSEDDTAPTILNDSWGYTINSEDNNPTTIVNEVPGHTSGPQRITFADAEMEAADALVSMKISGKNAKLNTHGKFCGQCGELSLGCEEDASDMEWYCQPCWKSWTDNYLSPNGIVEYRQLKLDYYNEDSCYPSFTDEVVYAEEINSISEKVQAIKEATVIHDESTNDLSYSQRTTDEYAKCATDEYAIVSRAYPNGSGIAIESVYLILSNGTVYPIEGDQNLNSSNYNPIIDEVVGNLKRVLNGNDDYDNYEGVY